MIQNRRNGTQLILIGVVVVVLVLGVGIFFATRGGGSSPSASAANGSPVVVAQQAIPQGTIFKGGDSLKPYFTVRQAPANLIPFGAYTSVDQIVGLTKSPGCGAVQAAGCQGQITVNQTIFQNTPVVSGMFSPLGQYRQSTGPSFAIPYGYVGLAITFDPVNSVYGSIAPGDDIDLMASYHSTQKIPDLKAPSQTQFVMNDLRVVSVNGPPAVPGGASGSSPSSASSSPPSSSSSAQTSGGTLIVLARYQQALEIQHLKDFGWQLSAVLRSAKETDVQHFKTLPVTDRWFFVKAGNPLKTNPGY